jgi:hypothetical protein
LPDRRAGSALSLVVPRLPKVPIGGSLTLFLAGTTLYGLTVATLRFKAQNGVYESILDFTGRAAPDLGTRVFVWQVKCVWQLATRQKWRASAWISLM